MSENRPTRIYEECPKHPVFGDCALVDGPSLEGDRTVDCSAYVAKRTAEGKTKKEIIRCLKRYIAREGYRVLASPSLSKPPILAP